MADFDADEIFRDLEDKEPEKSEGDERQELVFGAGGSLNPDDLYMGDDEY